MAGRVSHKIASTGTVIGRSAILRSFNVTIAVAAGRIVLRDGGAGGEIKLDAATDVASNLNTLNIHFETDIHATVTGVTEAVITRD